MFSWISDDHHGFWRTFQCPPCFPEEPNVNWALLINELVQKRRAFCSRELGKQGVPHNSAKSQFRDVWFQYYTSHCVRDASRFLPSGCFFLRDASFYHSSFYDYDHGETHRDVLRTKSLRLQNDKLTIVNEHKAVVVQSPGDEGVVKEMVEDIVVQAAGRTGLCLSPSSGRLLVSASLGRSRAACVSWADVVLATSDRHTATSTRRELNRRRHREVRPEQHRLCANRHSPGHCEQGGGVTEALVCRCHVDVTYHSLDYDVAHRVLHKGVKKSDFLSEAMYDGVNKTATRSTASTRTNTRADTLSPTQTSQAGRMSRLRVGALGEALLCLVRERFCRPHDGVHLPV